jgi:hypothetical protein
MMIRINLDVHLFVDIVNKFCHLVKEIFAADYITMITII